ncbi:MAG TPA: DEAD/DEAH box helicase [Bacillales bacterium]|nr:DEAD/DEAH box helicase [Bacillales bacterium]
MKFILHHSDGRPFLIPESFSTIGSADPSGEFHEPLPPTLDSTYSFSESLQHFLQGKQLLPDELPYSLESIHEHYLKGYVAYSAGLIRENGQYVCCRCGNDVQRRFATFPCSRCGKACPYCRECIMMGRVSMCTPLVRWCGPEVPYSGHARPLAWDGKLSDPQSIASDKVASAVGQSEELLVWAVCGAGKTEVLFQAIEEALRQGQRVCLASPRTDVILELAPRFRDAFPKTEMIVLYGGSEDRGKQGQLVLSTTHQLLRYKEAFDFIIIDEVDAFPFSTDRVLIYAVDQAKKSDATMVYLTATPDRPLKKRYEKEELAGVRISRRYHGHPLPIPTFRWCGNWRKSLKKGKLPEAAYEWAVRQLHNERQAFLFVPSVEVLEKVTGILQAVDERVIGVHAEDGERREKVQQFRSREAPIIVTTTILERGVTVANVDVVVLGADDKVFTEQALVQVSGRVGRSSSAPGGEILYFHYGRTKAMLDARRHIKAMNREAFPRERG